MFEAVRQDGLQTMAEASKAFMAPQRGRGALAAPDDVLVIEALSFSAPVAQAHFGSGL